jgi:cytochrome b561
MAMNRLDTTAERYDPMTVWLHWITVALVAALWAIGQTGDLAPRGPLRTGVWSTHVALGFLTAFVLVTRVAWRAHFGRVLAPADSGALFMIAKLTHYTLYVLLGLVVVAGIIDASYRGFNVFGLWSVPQFGSNDAATRRSINEWHELAANVLMLVVAVHGLAALGHHYVWRDRLLERMRP